MKFVQTATFSSPASCIQQTFKTETVIMLTQYLFDYVLLERYATYALLCASQGTLYTESTNLMTVLVMGESAMVCPGLHMRDSEMKSEHPP